MSQPGDALKPTPGGEMLPSMLVVDLHNDTSGRIFEQAENMTDNVYGSLAERIESIKVGKDIALTLLSSEAGPALEDLKTGRVVALRLTGLPRDPVLPPAPADGGTPHEKRTFISEAIGLGIASAIGRPSAMLGEKKEALVHQITPVPGREETQSNEGQVELMFHQDLAPNMDFPQSLRYDRFMLDWLVLTGVQTGSDTTKTYIASVDTALELLDDEAKTTLSQAAFVTDPPDSFKKEKSGVSSPLMPIHPVLAERDGHIEACFDISSGLRPVDPSDEESTRALQQLKDAFNAVKQEIIIQPGTAVAFNNRRVVHGRGAIGEEHDPANRRWIQRVYVFDEMRVLMEGMKTVGSLAMGDGFIALHDSLQSTERILAANGRD